MTQEQEQKFIEVAKKLRDDMQKQNELHDDFMLRGLKLGISPPILGLSITELSIFNSKEEINISFLDPVRRSGLLDDKQLEFLETEIDALYEYYMQLKACSKDVDRILSEVAPIQEDQIEKLEAIYKEIMTSRMENFMRPQP